MVKYLSVGNGIVIDVWTTKAVVESAIEEIKMNSWFVTDIKHARAQQDIIIIVLIFFEGKPWISYRHIYVSFSITIIVIVKYTVTVKIIVGTKLIIVTRIIIAIIISQRQ